MCHINPKGNKGFYISVLKRTWGWPEYPQLAEAMACGSERGVLTKNGPGREGRQELGAEKGGEGAGAKAGREKAGGGGRLVYTVYMGRACSLCSVVECRLYINSNWT